MTVQQDIADLQDDLNEIRREIANVKSKLLGAAAVSDLSQMHVVLQQQLNMIITRVTTLETKLDLLLTEKV